MVHFSSMKAIFQLTMGSSLALPTAQAAAGLDTSFLDVQGLQRQEDSILSSHRNSWNHRSLQELNCMDDLYSGSAGCTAADLSFLGVTGIQVYDPAAYFNATSGMWEGACLGSDDYVNISFTADIDVSNSRYDVGMYINTEGGNAYTGTCALSLLSNTDFKLGNTTAVPVETYVDGANTAYVGEFEGAAADYCPDITGSAILRNFKFAPLLLKCVDNDNDGSRKLDFDVAIAWNQNSGTYCNPNSTSTWPVPGAPSKCWKAKSRFNVDVYVPPYTTPSAQPSVSLVPSLAPSESTMPSASPSVSAKPSSSPSISTAPSASPTLSQQPSESPSISTAPSSIPSSSPSESPSASPSLSAAPSDSPTSSPSSIPSMSPSLSTAPSDSPSQSPSESPSSQPSQYPSDQPSQSPSVSAEPSSSPSNSPTLSSQPSVSSHPTTSTEFPSYAPSLSTKPSQSPSDVPSRSPTDFPSSIPSASPSDQPSSTPSVSPTDKPSASPSESPSISQLPTFNTPAPSESPSTSQVPSSSPTSAPSVSLMPSSVPSAEPSAAPSEAPTGSLYYPDWINENQVCVNDGADPEYMMQVQKDNYLYHSKEECCQNHFWWRVQQCMGNQKPMYYKNGEICDQKVIFEDWESKYTPGSWSSSNQFETLRECCVAKFWYDVEGCINASPKELTFTFTFSVDNIIEPTNCQDADIQAKALETAIDVGLGSSSSSTVSAIGCATLSQDPDTDNTICGGCLAGSYLGENYDGTRDAGYYTNSASATISVEVTTKSSDCADAACFSSLYSSIIADFSAFIASGDLTNEIVTWAQNRVPPIPELWNAAADTSSFSTSGSYTDPFNESGAAISATSVTTTGELTVTGFPEITTSTELHDATFYFESAIIETLEGQGVLPDGATVTVTGFSNGIVEYEITMSVASEDAAAQAVSQINTSFDDAATLTLITSAVQTKSSGGTLSFTSMSVDSNTAGAAETTTISKATSSGELTTSVDASSMSSAEIADLETYFEDAIMETLQSEGSLPDGSFVQVTGISDGTVSYEIIMYVSPDSDVGSIVSSIDATLSKTSTLFAIADSVKTSSIGTTIETSLSTLAVSDFTPGETTGIPDTQWYPLFDEESSGCKNNGFEPSYMKENPIYYLFSSQKECCDQWFSYDPFCVASTSTKKKFYPDLSSGGCGRKQLKDFESYERERYDTLEECCSDKFSGYGYDQCCASPGMGGCTPTGVVAYLPDWYNSVCFQKSESALADHEKVTAYTSASDCCSELFGWKKSACCKAAGGC